MYLQIKSAANAQIGLEVLNFVGLEDVHFEIKFAVPPINAAKNIDNQSAIVCIPCPPGVGL